MADRGYWDVKAESSESGRSSYWKGAYGAFRPPSDSESERPKGAESTARSVDAQSRSEADGYREPLHYGSMSARARQAYAAEALRYKDHVSAGLLAIFLGVFGVHKFYLGYNQTGFIMLAVSIIGGILTLGLASAVIAVIAAIEGIIYLTKSQTEFDRIYVLNQRDWF